MQKEKSIDIARETSLYVEEDERKYKARKELDEIRKEYPSVVNRIECLSGIDLVA